MLLRRQRSLYGMPDQKHTQCEQVRVREGRSGEGKVGPLEVGRRAFSDENHWPRWRARAFQKTGLKICQMLI